MNYLINSINNDLMTSGSEFRCKTISWNDASRFSGPGGLSSIGPNIQDARLVTKDNTLLYTIRPENWNEKIGTVSTKDIAIIDTIDNKLKPITLKEYLDRNNLSVDGLDNEVSIRFQTTFLPLKNNTDLDLDLNIIDNKDDSIEFCPEVYSYNTPSDDNPRNLLLMVTTQGLTLHKNTNKYQKLFLSEKTTDGKMVNKWLSAEKTSFKVGSQQIETDEEAAYAQSRNKAVSAVIGTKSMGSRFNALLTIQIPVQQHIIRIPEQNWDFAVKNPMYPIPYSYTKSYSACLTDQTEMLCQSSYVTKGCKTRSVHGPEISLGQSNSARISKGSVAGIHDVVDISKYKRDLSQHITITIILYNTVVGGVPSKEDVMAAVNELESLYRDLKTGRLSETSYMQTNKLSNYSFNKEPQFINRTMFPTFT